MDIYFIETYYIWCKFFITFVVDITFGVNFLLHLWLTVRSVNYYIWCKLFITFVVDVTFGVIFSITFTVDITFGVNSLLHL